MQEIKTEKKAAEPAAEKIAATAAPEKKPEPKKQQEPEKQEKSSDYVEQKKKRRAAKAKATDALDLGRKTVEELTAIFNEMVGTAVDLGIKNIDVRKDTFPIPAQGVRACERLHSLIQKTREQKDKSKESHVKKASKKTAKKSKSARKSGPRAKRAAFEETQKITWKGKDTPFREGPGRGKRTEVVRTSSGKTVKTFLASRGKLGTLAYCVRNGLAGVS